MNAKHLAGWSKLVSTNIVGGVLQLVGFAIAAQALELAALGVIVLIQAYAKIVDGVFNFQSVNVLTRFLAQAEQTDDKAWFGGLVKAGLLVDAGTAALATTIAIAAMPLVAPLAGIPDGWVGPAMMFCLVILTRLLGATEASLRVFDGFWAIGLRGTVQGVLLVAGSAVLWTTGAGAIDFLYLWLASEVAANLWFLWHCWRVLGRNGIRHLHRAEARAAIKAAPGFWPMLWQTNATFGIRMLSQDADVLVAGTILGPGAASLLRAAKNVAGVVSQLGRPLQQVASGPISTLAAEGRYWNVIQEAARIGALSAAAGLAITAVFLVLGDILLRLAFGPQFAAAYWLIVILLIAKTIYLSGVALLPTMLALDLHREFLFSVILGTLAFAIVLMLSAEQFGIIGIACAQIAFEVVWVASCCKWSIRRAKLLKNSTT